MSTPIEFTGNYEDLSTDTGFQFKFYCERCQNGYMSSFQRNAVGVAGALLQGASSLLGGLFSQGADASYHVQRLVGGPAHDAAVRKAVEEIRPLFRQCGHCGNWCCAQVCWNENARQCKNCAPLADEVEASTRARHVETQVTNDLFLEENQRMSARAKEVAAKCSCGAPTMGKKFCPDCGKPTGAGAKFCPECGSRSTPGAKFCPDCGTGLS